MDNKVGLNDKQKNVAEEEVAPPHNIRENVSIKDQVEGKIEAGSSTTTTQKYVVGDTNQSVTAEVGAKASSSLESPKPQKTALQSTSQSTSKSILTTSSNPYKPNAMFFKPENHISSDSQSHTHFSDAGEQKNLTEIAEDGTLTQRLAETETSSPTISPGQPDALSSNVSTSRITTHKKIIRIDRDYTRGELCQFQPAFPLEIDGRINPRRFQQTINTLNEMLSKAHDPKYNFFDNCLGCLTIYTSTLCLRSRFDRMIEEICKFLDRENINLYNPQGLNFRDPRRTSFLFVSFVNQFGFLFQ